MADKDKIVIGNLFAVHHGDYAGQFFSLQKINKKFYYFLAMPDMKNVEVPVKDFLDGYKKDIIRFCDDPLDEVKEVCEAQYKANENSND